MIHDLIYLLEITEVDDLELSDKKLVQIGMYLLRNIRSDHSMSGSNYNQLLGVCQWYTENRFLTEKQSYWLRYCLKDNIHQRNFEYEF